MTSLVPLVSKPGHLADRTIPGGSVHSHMKQQVLANLFRRAVAILNGQSHGQTGEDGTSCASGGRHIVPHLIMTDGYDISAVDEVLLPQVCSPPSALHWPAKYVIVCSGFRWCLT